MSSSMHRVPLRQVLLAYALLLAVLLSAWLTLLEPWQRAYRDRQGQIEIQLDRMGNLERAVATDPALDAEAAKALTDKLQAYIARSSIAARTSDIAGSLLQQRLVGMVKDHGGAAGNTRIIGDPDSGSITVSIQFTIDLAGLSNVLHDLDTGRPQIFVDVLSIQDDLAYRTESGPVRGPQSLAVQLDASSFWFGPSSSGKGS